MSGASNLSTFWQWDHVCGQLWGVGLYYWKRAFYFRGCFNEWSLVSLSFSRVWYCHYRLHIRELTAWPQRQRHRERERERERENTYMDICFFDIFYKTLSVFLHSNFGCYESDIHIWFLLSKTNIPRPTDNLNLSLPLSLISHWSWYHLWVMLMLAEDYIGWWWW